jgi:hypothetical protein
MVDWIYRLAQIDSTNLGLPQVEADDTQLEDIMAVVFGGVAAVAVLVIMFASINYITAGGDPDKISRSKKTIIFALVGLAIAIFAESIVLTVLGRF